MPWLYSLQCNGCPEVIPGFAGDTKVELADTARRRKWELLWVETHAGVTGQYWYCPTCARILEYERLVVAGDDAR